MPSKVERNSRSPTMENEGCLKERGLRELQLSCKRQDCETRQDVHGELAKTPLKNLQYLWESAYSQLRILNAVLHTDGDESSSVQQIFCAAANFRESTSLSMWNTPQLTQDLPAPIPKPGLFRVDCRCGVDHKIQSVCLEHSTFSVLYNSHILLATSMDFSRITHLPRTPSLIDIFRPATSKNRVIQILGSFFYQVRPTNAHSLLAFCMIMYRLLRWRLYPVQQTYQDIPGWLCPTEIQNSIIHPLSIDFLPWPRLRDYLTIRSCADLADQDIRHSAHLYIQCIRFQWPTNKEFVHTTVSGELFLDPEFDAAIYQYENWMLSEEWARMFEPLRGLVNVEGTCTHHNTPFLFQEDI
ncbi:hypothetical protein BGW36DRAFT_380357 [Talaromyces proteolyticus]|uniref:Uncharacterized protein n=1 Tax=Talaromyces proteolyticus TaxID=1131652 RepID=A0AAD4PTW4_9EURO|nr:uncharacterized protein BGW36DRAFT_392472 [Talaromyces proteolyticus]XP_046071096.1 uncharacterized protein BGW36DRAFT_380357 [Talaromyces proteolyticus]KAH8688589.1 hypothetical protein BGW36DRAFT_392472 [Talaromyces proteolyticus]KAH8696158.1 hypothetical protein BGW36DRAFT_380357 [Talaromyces proteolyticus]